MNENKLKTFMSPVYYRSPANPQGKKEPPLFEFPDKDLQTFLFDDLLQGGILIPDSILDGIGKDDTHTKVRGLFVLVSGPPGSGKSIFALELCYRLATNDNSNGIGVTGKGGLSSVYVSTASSSADLIQHAHDLGWDDKGEIIVPWAGTQTFPQVHIYGAEHADLAPKAGEGPKAYFDLIHRNWARATEKTPNRASVLVFDGLNVLPKDWQAWKVDDVMRTLVETCLRGPLLMIAIYDTPTGIWGFQKPTQWDYFADMTIHMGYLKEEDYLVRKTQIVKARYQDHADGEHRLKINAKPGEGIVRDPMSPFIKEGGIFIFPSVHRYLSVARRQVTEDTSRLKHPLPTPFDNLNSIIQNRGFPCSSCTAIVGSRGGMKSHLAYYTLLKFLRDNPKERALIISLRDPEEAAKDTLADILGKQRDDNGKKLHSKIRNPGEARRLLEQYLDEDRLEIQFFWPGYISPEEFFHLVLVAVDRAPKGKKCSSFVVVNGLEQLSARFPLCAREKMFVSGLITLLRVRGTTSLVVSAGDVAAPPETTGVPAGLLQMADLIIESSFRLCPKDRIWSDAVWRDDKWRSVLEEKQSQGQDGPQEKEPHVIYQVIRGPGARECRRRTLFYMGREKDPKPLCEGSVYVRPLPDNFPYGEKIEKM